jgi:hypothetical protein
MTTTICYGDAADGYLENFSGTYTAARDGTGTYSIVDTSDTVARWGQKFSGGTYFASEAFLSWAYTVPATETVTAAYIRVRASSALSTGVTRALEIREYDWGATMTSADWRTAAAFSALPQIANIDSAQNAGTLYISAGSTTLVTRLASASPLRVVCTSDRQRSSTTPSVDEEAYLSSSDASGTGDDPALIFTSIVTHRLNTVLGAQVQLSDGTHAYIENNTVGTASFALKHRDAAGAVTTVATLAASSAADPTEYFSTTDATPGAQKLALAVDSSNNLYVVGIYGGNTVTAVAAKAFTKGVGYTWTAQTFRSASLTSYSEATLNNVAVAWHNVGTSGTIMAVLEHGWGRSPNTTGDGVYALLNCQYLLTGTGSLLRGSGSGRGTVVSDLVDGNNHTNHVNPVGSVLDVVAAVSSNDVGYVLSPFAYTTGIGDAESPSVFRYKLNAGGTAISSSIDDTPTSWATKDAAAKLRIVAVDSTTLVTVTADPTAAWGLTVEVMQVSGGSYFVRLGRVKLDSAFASMPSMTTLSTSQLWDAVYDPTANLVWIYYFDTANNRRLMRTSINMSTYLASNNEVEVSLTVGGVGGTNYALRVHRGKLNGQTVLVSVANKDSGGTHSTQYVADTFNVAPTAPTLTARANFDATASAAFAWTFNDPNPGDTQSAYQLQINTSGGVFEYDTAKVSAAAATYVGSGAAATGNNASLAPAVPSGNAGDTLVCWASIRNSGTGTVGTAPSGWQTLLTFGNVSLLGKVADAASETAPTVTFSGGAANEDTLARVHRFRNMPLNVVASATLLNASAANVAYPALTVPLANSVVFVYGWKQDDWTSVAVALGAEIDDTFSTAGNDAAQGLDYVIQTTATNVAASSFTVTGGAAAISRGVVVSMGPAGHTATTASHTLPANTLTNAASWQWRVRTWDAAGLLGTWSNYSTFSTAAGGNVSITSPASDNPGGQITDDYTITWSATGTVQAYYRVKVVRTSDSSTLSDTGFVASVATSAGISGLLSGVEYRVEVTVRNAGLVDSGTGTRLITPSYSSPDTPTVTLTAYDDAGYILVSVDNPAPTGDKPLPSTNQILRRVSGSGDDYTVIGTCVADGTYRDYAAASGVTYQYVVRAVAL